MKHSSPSYNWPIPLPPGFAADEHLRALIDSFWGWVMPFRARYAGVLPVELCPRQAALVERICTAFAGVGVGADTPLYLSGAAEDDYLPESYQAFLRMHEERQDWQRIPADVLFCLHDCFSYLEPEGVRFLLPAYMVADLRHPTAHWSSDYGLQFALFSSWPGTRLNVLNDAQRACVTDYVNEKRLEEAPEWGDVPFHDWRTLLPWEDDALRATEPGKYPYRYAEEQLLNYCQRNDIDLP